jgi:hypothetical protein
MVFWDDTGFQTDQLRGRFPATGGLSGAGSHHKPTSHQCSWSAGFRDSKRVSEMRMCSLLQFLADRVSTFCLVNSAPPMSMAWMLSLRNHQSTYAYYEDPFFHQTEHHSHDIPCLKNLQQFDVYFPRIHFACLACCSKSFIFVFKWCTVFSW